MLTSKFKENLISLEKKKSPDEKDNAYIEEPKPGPTHLFCAVCREAFKDYY
jgi:hypothetical protein